MASFFRKKTSSLIKSAGLAPIFTKLESGLVVEKTSLEGNNSISICCSTFLVYFLTMASQTGCEIMNSEIAGSIFTVFPRKKRHLFSHVQEPAKLNPLKTTMRALDRIIASHSNTEKVALDTGYLIGVPDIIWVNVRYSGGECGAKNEFIRK